MEKNEVLLRVDHLCQYFGPTKAVDDVSFDIYKGEVFGLVGESGCGKTTTGRSIIRLYDITSGNIYFKGVRIGAGIRNYQVAIAEAREKGDLSENAEYDAAREAQGLLEVKIAKLKDLVANAKIIDESQVNTDKVQMLNKVKVENLSMKQVMEFTIVGETEADFAHGKLAATTPIAKALLGHAKGDVVEAHVPSGVIKFKILDISI